MYVGHYAAAAVIIAAVPEPTVLPVVLPAAIGVAWPDLVWPALVLTGVEKVTISRTDPLQRAVRFDWYPWSHSLVRSNLLALIPALGFVLVFQTWVAGLVFWFAAVSHWVFDLAVHQPDLPVLGFGTNDPKLGAGLWQFPPTAFILEYLFFAATVLLVAPSSMRVGLLAGGLVLHLLNANSAFGFTKTNPFRTPARFALVVLIGYAASTVWFLMAWQ